MKILSLTLVYDLRFFLFFSLFFAHNSARSNNPSLRLISPQTIHKKKKKKNTNRPIRNTKTTNHHRPNDQRGARIEKSKISKAAGRQEDRVSPLKTILRSPCILFSQLFGNVLTSRVFFSVFSFFSYHLSLFLSHYLSVSVSVSIAVSLYLSHFFIFFSPPLFLLIV